MHIYTEAVITGPARCEYEVRVAIYYLSYLFYLSLASLFNK